jgi:LysR family nitrogen assimilation transcriptional regulator
MKSTMDLRHLRTFVSVAELGTVSKAAERLRIAQPALSRQIAMFERELGLKLFDRVGRRLVLTGAGEELLGDCRLLLLQATGIGERAQLLRHGDTGALRIAASPQFIESVLSEFLRLYAREFPKVQVTTVEAISWSDTMTMLDRREVHLGQNLLSAMHSDEERFTKFPLEAMELLAAGAPLVMRDVGDSIDLELLASYPLLVLDKGFASRRNFDSTRRAAGIEARIVFESRTPHTLLAMAESGHGVAIVPSAVRINRYCLSTARLTHNGQPLREPLALFWEKQRRLPRYGEAFCELLADHVRRVFPISRPARYDLLHKERRARPS